VATEPILVIDADLNKRIATELKRRGRQAVALSELHLRHVKDPELLRALAAHFGDKPWILVTGDDNMPAVHADVIHEVGATLATVDPRWPPGYRGDEDAWGREVVHRWAHLIEKQSPGSVRRYSSGGGRSWTRRRR
jgi:hypothetical protein